MKLQGNRIRHSTLWDRDGFVDFKMNDKLNDDIDVYLYGYDYLIDQSNTQPIVLQFYFWELK